MKLKSVRILLKIIHLASGSHIWSLFAQNQTLTKMKSRSIASQITNLASEVVSGIYFTQFISKVDQKVKSGQVGVGSIMFINACLAHRKSYVVIICANSCQKLTKSEIESSLKSVQTWLRISCSGDRKSYVVIICASSCEKVYQKWNLSRYCSKSLPYFPIWPLKVIQGQIMRSTEHA